MNHKINMPEKVKYILETLREAGFEAYAVGGCVRDSLMGKTPHDWDLTTSALPEQVKALFRRTLDTGIQHGTVTVMLESEGFEVTTYRLDGDYEDGRHPKEVTFTSNLIEDLKRRDFTINAMAYNDEQGVVDEFDGIGDLERGIIRCVGDPEERFSEDALRMLRAIRFSAQLGYEIHEDTLDAIRKMAQNLKRVSAERIQTELIKTLVSDHPEVLRVAYEVGLTAVFLPEFDRCMKTPQNNPHHCYNVGEHILHSVMAIRADKVLRVTMLLHDVGKPDTLTIDENGITHNHGHPEVGMDKTVEILKRLKFDNETIRQAARLVRYHDYRMEPSPKAIRRVAYMIGPELFWNLLEVQSADLAAQSEYQREEKESRVREVRVIYQRILEEGNALSVKDLAIGGNDLRAAGMKPGPQMGVVLNLLLDAVLDEPELNTKEKLMELYLKWQDDADK